MHDGKEYNHVPYTFRKNLQGDIITIADSTGNSVARYECDAWGVCTVTENNSANIAQVNPFRYRGYYYDSETSLYYLQSRYYDSSIGRFINSDEGIMGILSYSTEKSNLYSYCENAIITKRDNTGYNSNFTYSGITCTKTKVGFDVKCNYRFILKTFCKLLAIKIIQEWGRNGKYCSMNSHRIAAEIFAHVILFLVGVIVGAYSIWNLVYAWRAKVYLDKVMAIVRGAISGYFSYYLISHSALINVNYNEPWYKEAAFEVIWGFFPPLMW